MSDLEPAEGEALVAFIEVMRRLRAECNWKAAQTHASLARYLLEETYETLEAIDVGDPSRLRDELGDLLLQIYFHSAIAAERGEFTIDDVAAGLRAKMIRRNPHVFGTAQEREASRDLAPAAIDEAWQRIKSAEKTPAEASSLDRIPAELPALLWATKALEKGLLAESAPAGGVGAAQRDDRRDDQQDDQLDDQLDDRALGEALLALVVQARRAGLDPESALRHTVRRMANASRPDPAP
ncbi:MAG: MazG nucleotide pyrophosphohydrolase domain-containing protein [Nocardioides sp.]